MWQIENMSKNHSTARDKAADNRTGWHVTTALNGM